MLRTPLISGPVAGPKMLRAPEAPTAWEPGQARRSELSASSRPKARVWTAGWTPLVALCLLVLLPGCAKNVDLRVDTSACLNPAEYCNEDGSNSNVLNVFVYQLTDPIPGYASKHALLRDPAAVFADTDLAPFLAEGHLQALEPTSITLRRSDSNIFVVERRKKARHLLIVTDGRQVEDNSMVLIPLSRFQDAARLCFEYYGGKYIEPLAESYCHFEFQMPTTTGVIEKEQGQ